MCYLFVIHSNNYYLLAYFFKDLFEKWTKHYDEMKRIELKNSRKEPQIAFLFLVYDKIERVDLWNEFFKYADPNKYSIYFHSKDANVNSLDLASFNQPIQIPTIENAYMTITLVKTMSLLVRAALKDK